jgi:hypothetical protein
MISSDDLPSKRKLAMMQENEINEEKSLNSIAHVTSPGYVLYYLNEIERENYKPYLLYPSKLLWGNKIPILTQKGSVHIHFKNFKIQHGDDKSHYTHVSQHGGTFKTSTSYYQQSMLHVAIMKDFTNSGIIPNYISQRTFKYFRFFLELDIVLSADEVDKLSKGDSSKEYHSAIKPVVKMCDRVVRSFFPEGGTTAIILKTQKKTIDAKGSVKFGVHIIYNHIVTRLMAIQIREEIIQAGLKKKYGTNREYWENLVDRGPYMTNLRVAYNYKWETCPPCKKIKDKRNKCLYGSDNGGHIKGACTICAEYNAKLKACLKCGGGKIDPRYYEYHRIIDEDGEFTNIEDEEMVQWSNLYPEEEVNKKISLILTTLKLSSIHVMDTERVSTFYKVPKNAHNPKQKDIDFITKDKKDKVVIDKHTMKIAEAIFSLMPLNYRENFEVQTIEDDKIYLKRWEDVKECALCEKKGGHDRKGMTILCDTRGNLTYWCQNPPNGPKNKQNLGKLSDLNPDLFDLQPLGEKSKFKSAWEYLKSIECKNTFDVEDPFTWLDFVHKHEKITYDSYEASQIAISKDVHRVYAQIEKGRTSVIRKHAVKGNQLFDFVPVSSSHLNIHFMGWKDGEPIKKMETWQKWSQKNSHFIPKYRDVTCEMDPSKTREVSDSNIFNAFQGFLAKPVKKEVFNKEIIRMLLEHIYIILADRDIITYIYIVSWVAHLLRTPWIKTKTILNFIQQEQQTGRGMFFTWLIEQVLGHHLAIMVRGLEIFQQQWNQWMFGKILCVCDEISVDKKTDLQVNDILKNLITESHMQIKQRYMDEKTVPNNFNGVTITNHEDANVVSVGDARKVIIHSSAEKKGTKWFAELGAMMKDKNLNLSGQFLRWIIDLPDEFLLNLQKIPQTEARKDAIIRSVPNPLCFLNDLQTKAYPIGTNIKLAVERTEKLDGSFEDTSKIAGSALYKGYKEWCLFNTCKIMDHASFGKTIWNKDNPNPIIEKKKVHGIIIYNLKTINLPKNLTNQQLRENFKRTNIMMCLNHSQA